MLSKLVNSAIVITLVSVAGLMPALADAYTSATFSGGIFGGSANVQAPFSGNGFHQGDTFTGTFVFDNDLVPAPGSGFANVSFQSFPDSGNIPYTSAFHLAFDGLDLDLGDDIGGSIQYNNSHFNGFAANFDFTFNALPYQLTISGGSLSVYAIVDGDPTFNSLINGYINIGDNNITGKTVFTPTAVVTPPTTDVPEPITLSLFGAGLAGAIAMRRRKKAKPA